MCDVALLLLDLLASKASSKGLGSRVLEPALVAQAALTHLPIAANRHAESKRDPIISLSQLQ